VKPSGAPEEGDLVKHESFGTGLVIESRGIECKVMWGEWGLFIHKDADSWSEWCRRSQLEVISEAQP
tara:strand:+ start:24 stop:224 length:201 start_codon:yes stop_codon:yes gene_type:complete